MKNVKVGQVYKSLDNRLILLILKKSYFEMEDKLSNVSILIPNFCIVKSRNSMVEKDNCWDTLILSNTAAPFTVGEIVEYYLPKEYMELIA